MNVLVGLKSCPNCKLAKQLMERQGFDFKYYDAFSREGQKYLKISNVKQMPQLFKNDKFEKSGMAVLNTVDVRNK